jgi:hypothetical protein
VKNVREIGRRTVKKKPSPRTYLKDLHARRGTGRSKPVEKTNAGPALKAPRPPEAETTNQWAPTKVDGVNVFHTFEWPRDRMLAFSDRCPDCDRWIHLLKKAGGEGACMCGARFRIEFDREQDWVLLEGPHCMDCGRALQAEAAGKCVAWEDIGSAHQWQCSKCRKNEPRVEVVRGLQRQARTGYAHLLAWFEENEDETIQHLLTRARLELAEVAAHQRRVLRAMIERGDEREDALLESTVEKLQATIKELGAQAERVNVARELRQHQDIERAIAAALARRRARQLGSDSNR